MLNIIEVYGKGHDNDSFALTHTHIYTYAIW